MQQILQKITLGFLLGCFIVVIQATAAPEQPNVLIVNIDNFIGEMLGCYGNSFIDTPNLDTFSKSAVIFNNHVSVGRCSASRASLMTGRHYVRMGALETHSNHQFLGRSEKTLGDHFRQNGYRTAMIGKWHLGNNYPYRPEDRGFDEVLTYFHSYSPKNPDGFRLRHNGRRKAFTGFRGTPWFDYSERFIRANSDRPFCLYVATSMTHAPNLGPEDLYEKYRDKLITSGQIGQALATKRESLVKRYSGDALEKAAQKAVDTNIHVYAEVEFIDRGFGRLIRALHQTGQFDNTIILFCSDGNGPGPFPFHLDKVAMPEPEFRHSTFCCMIRWPGALLRGGYVITERTANFDVLPTLLDLCGLNSIQGVTFDGQSFRSLLEGKPEAWKPRYFIMDNTSAYSQEPEWPAIRLRPLHRTTIINPKGGHATWIRGELTEKQNVTPIELDTMKAHYLDYWTSAFYTRAPIHYLIVGTEHENPMHIHKHYCPAVSSPLRATQRPGKKSTRYRWPVEFATPGRYRIQFYQVGERAFVVDPLPKQYPEAHKARLTVEGIKYDWNEEQGGLPTFEIEVKPGQYLLGAEVNPGNKGQNPEWLVIEKLN
jgi:arylsulfatase A-like enzyme